MTIDGKIELIKATTKLFSTGDIIAIIVAFISLFGVIITTIMTNKTTKKLIDLMKIYKKNGIKKVLMQV